MKRIAILLTTIGLFTSCFNQDDFIEGTAINFYPTVYAVADEEDGLLYRLRLEASGPVNGTGTVEITVSNPGSLYTVPAIQGNKIFIEMTDTRTAEIEVRVLNDLIPDNYMSEFRITRVSGAIQSIGRDKFSMLVRDADILAVFEENFNSGLGSFTPYNVVGAQVWTATNFGLGATGGARMNGFSGSAQNNEDWLISQRFDLTAFEAISASFYSDVRFAGPSMEFLISTNYSGSGDPNLATWTKLNPILDTNLGLDTWTYSGKVDVSGFISNGTYFAFKYTSTTSAAAQWTIDDFTLNIFDPFASSGSASFLFALPFTDDFEECTTDGAIPANFVEVFSAESKTDRGWSCRPFGVDGSRGVRANSFGGTAGDDNVWLISAKKFDLRNVTGATLKFDARSAAAGPGTLRVLYSATYFGGDPTSANWTELNVTLPAQGSNTFQEVTANLVGAVGSTIYLAFQFEGGTHTSSASYDIDNVSVTGTGGSTPLTLPFTDSFEACASAGEFNIPENWREEVVPGSKTDRGWGCRDADTNLSPRTGAWLMSASAFGGTAGSDNTYAILRNPVNFNALTTVNLSFWVDLDFATDPGTLTFEYSTNYSGSGNPASATWMVVTAVSSQLPTENTTSWQEITANLSAINGSQVYLAFHFSGGTSAASKRWNIEDFSLTGN
jgi:hypothetical protein